MTEAGGYDSPAKMMGHYNVSESTRRKWTRPTPTFIGFLRDYAHRCNVDATLLIERWELVPIATIVRPSQRPTTRRVLAQWEVDALRTLAEAQAAIIYEEPGKEIEALRKRVDAQLTDAVARRS